MANNNTKYPKSDHTQIETVFFCFMKIHCTKSCICCVHQSMAFEIYTFGNFTYMKRQVIYQALLWLSENQDMTNLIKEWGIYNIYIYIYAHLRVKCTCG